MREMNYPKAEEKAPPSRHARLQRRAAASAFALVAALLCTAYANAAVVSIARGGDTAPSSGGATFTSFDEPMVNESGDVVFVGFLSDGGEGVYFMSKGGSLTKIARDGDTVSGATLSNDFDGPAINDDKTIYFVNRGMTGPFANALFAKPDHSTLGAIIKQGDTAPGTNGTFDSFNDMGVNQIKGDIAIIASYTEDHGSTFNIGVWLNKLVNKSTGKTKLVEVVKSGDALPGAGGGVISSNIGGDLDCIDGPWVGENRLVAFAIDCITNDVNSVEESIWARAGTGKIKPFILKTDTPPAALGGTVSSLAVGRPGLANNVLSLALEVNGGSTSAGIVTKPLSKPTQKAFVCTENGAPAPGSTGTISDLAQPTLNSLGELIFHSPIAGDVDNNGGLFECETKGANKGRLTQIVLSSDSKPGGGTWMNIEEDSSSKSFATFLDDTSGSEAGVFLADIPSP